MTNWTEINFSPLVAFTAAMSQLYFSLSASLVLVAIFGTLLIFWVSRKKWKIILSKRDPSVSVIPGDPSFPFIGHLYQLLISGAGFIHLLHSWTVRHGDICKFSLGPGKHGVLINNANMIQKLLTSKEHLTRPPFIYEKIFGHSDLFRFGLAILPVPRWKEHRTILNRAFTYNSLRTYIPILNKFGKDIVSEITKETEGGDAENGTVVPLFRLTHIATLRVVSFITLGEIIFSPSHLKDTLKFHENLQVAKSLGTELIVKPWLLLKPIWHFHSIRKTLQRVMDEIEKYFHMIIAQSQHMNHELSVKPAEPLESEGSSKARETFRSLVELMQKEGDMNEAEICAEAATNILGGHETVSTSMMFLMYNLAVHRNHQQECQREIDSMFEMASSGNVNMESFQNLKHLERCIKESLRIFPTFPAFARESSTSYFKLSDEHNVPPGTIIMVSPWALHRNPEYYPDPEKFDPDRFLPENSQKRNSYAYMPFSAGSRDCIGWKLAMMKMLILTSWILHHFDISAEPSNLKELKFHFDITLSTQPEIKFTLKSRSG